MAARMASGKRTHDSSNFWYRPQPPSSSSTCSQWNFCSILCLMSSFHLAKLGRFGVRLSWLTSATSLSWWGDWTAWTRLLLMLLLQCSIEAAEEAMMSQSSESLSAVVFNGTTSAARAISRLCGAAHGTPLTTTTTIEARARCEWVSEHSAAAIHRSTAFLLHLYQSLLQYSFAFCTSNQFENLALLCSPSTSSITWWQDTPNTSLIVRTTLPFLNIYSLPFENTLPSNTNCR